MLSLSNGRCAAHETTIITALTAFLVIGPLAEFAGPVAADATANSSVEQSNEQVNEQAQTAIANAEATDESTTDITVDIGDGDDGGPGNQEGQ